MRFIHTLLFPLSFLIFLSSSLDMLEQEMKVTSDLISTLHKRAEALSTLRTSLLSAGTLIPVLLT